MAQEKNWFTKTKARDAITELTATLLASEDISEEAKVQLDKLFAGKTVATNTLVRNVDGEVVMKRCSYFEGYLPISEFGTVGKDDKGEVKFSYQSKAGSAAVRATKTALQKALDEADENLEVDEDIKAWKTAKAEAVADSEIKAEYDGDEVLIMTFEDAQEEVANQE